ncbi:hypothetical protein Tco_0010306 [Tanacetum coccineum]
MANLSFADPIYDEAGPSYDSDILSEVHDHDHYQDVVCEHHEEHEMHDDVQPNYIVDSHANYTSDSNMIPYEQYVKDNAVSVVQRNVSSVPNDAYMMIFNDMHKPHAQPVSVTTRNTIVDNSLTVELATYKEQVKLYERRARFELTEREQRIDEQLRIVITDRNVKEETLKKELHSVKMQLASTINHNKSNPALYNGYEIIKNNHVPAIVHNTEDTLEIAEITRRKMNDKMKDPKCVTNKVKIAPPDYSKENYLATFTPQKQLTPEQIFWSQDLIKMKAEALKKQTTASRPINALKVYPLNTPATLVPRVLPTKSQVKINIFTLIQLFLEFEKTCKKRITPTGLTEGERGFEQTKECYLTEIRFKMDINNELVKMVSNLERNSLSDFDSAFVIRKMKASLQGKDNVINKLKTQISHLQETHSEADRTFDFMALDFQITQLTEKVTALQEQNKIFRAENAKIKQHYKELYDSIKVTRAKHLEQTNALTTKNENLKAQMQTKMKNVTKDHVKPTVLTLGKYAIDVEPIPPHNRNNREVHLDYLRHLKESKETLCEIVKEAKVKQPLDRSIVFACCYTKHS